jgi:uncharacterized coiled-coil protein SlyX
MRQRRDAKLEADAAGADAGETELDDDQRRIVALERRVEELEALLEGLQDAVHREMTRQSRELAALAARTQAPEMARALGKYSRERGL